ncbi:restriction endonuclease subunit S [Burkholderia oklahomensis]|uniref:restriction endonuclease subunit S n=1 Tax=Burkholderia oklahomensis TaxID=342113 RepID=UPI00264F1F23|nr:restriction endonuclease subunit S [Burkholderia oklahomensis]MDN7676647.1 restriction endonuclease subunit S [Burkholderia oklahomensis]
MVPETHAPTIGEVISLVRGTTYKSALLGQPGPVLLGLASIQRNGGFRDDSLKTYGGESKRNQLLKPGDLFVSLKDVTQSADLLGAVARVPASVASGRLTQDTVKLDFGNNEYPRDLVYWTLRTPQYRAYCRGHSTGTTNLGLPREDFLAYRLPAPTSDALSLVEALEALDDRVANLRQTNATLQAIAAALFKSRFVDFDGVPPEDMQESELGLIPKGWRAGTLADLCELKYGKALKATERRKGEVPVYGSGGITGFHDKALITKPTIIVGRKGTVGSLYWQSEPCFPIDTVFYVESKVSLNFCYHAMMLMGLHNLNTDAAVPGLNRDNAYRQSVVIPGAEALQEWDAIASSIRARIDAADQQAATLAALRDTLLPRLISGQLRVPQ